MADLLDPITSRDWFCYDLFGDPDFVKIRNEFSNEVAKYDPGLSQLIEQAASDEIELLLSIYAKRVSDLFDVSEEIARKGLFHSRYINTWSRNRQTAVSIDSNYIVIKIRSETRIEDIKKIWKAKILPLQDELSVNRSKRLKSSEHPSLAFTIHKHRLMGRKMSDIHNDYQHMKLAGYIGEYGNEEYSEFVRHYKNTVSGIKKSH